MENYIKLNTVSEYCNYLWLGLMGLAFTLLIAALIGATTLAARDIPGDIYQRSVNRFKANTEHMPSIEQNFVLKAMNGCLKHKFPIHRMIASRKNISKYALPFVPVEDSLRDELSGVNLAHCLKSYVLSSTTLRDIYHRNNRLAEHRYAPFSDNELNLLTQR